MSEPSPPAPAFHSPGGIQIHDPPDRETGAIRRFFLYAPAGPAPERGWPGLVLTDGNAVIATAVDAMRAQAFWPAGTNLGWGVLIGIGGPTDGPYDAFRRSWDFGPPPGRGYPPFQKAGAEAETRRAQALVTRTVGAAQDFADALAAHPGVEVTYETYAGETHMSVLPGAVNRALQLAFGVWRPLPRAGADHSRG